MKPTKEPLGESDNHCQFALIIPLRISFLKSTWTQWTPKDIQTSWESHFVCLRYHCSFFFVFFMIIPLVEPSEAPIFRDPFEAVARRLWRRLAWAPTRPLPWSTRPSDGRHDGDAEIRRGDPGIYFKPQKGCWKMALRTKFWVGGLVAIFYFSIYMGIIIIPIDFHIFQRGGWTTNQ